MKLDYKLMKGDKLLGILCNTTIDQPWFECDFVPTAEFESVRALFDRAYAQSNGDAFDELERQGVWLADATTFARVVPEGDFLCQIQDGKARFRM